MAIDGVILMLPLFLCCGSYGDPHRPIQHCEMTCDTCAKGWYGPNCTLECSNCQIDQCDKTTGECDNCRHGHHGRRCNEKCPPHCGGSRACNRDSGNCDDRCLQHYWGPRCERNCSRMCNGSVCIQNTGECHLGCRDGSTGYYCNVSCETGCVNTTCAHITKACIECKNGNYPFGVCENSGLCNSMCDQCYKEERCKAQSTRSKLTNGTLDESETDAPGAGSVIGAVFGVIVVISLVVVGVIVYRRWYRNRRGGRESPGPEAVKMSHTEEISPQTDAGNESDKFTVKDASSSSNI